jgi:hypothetical protein
VRDKKLPADPPIVSYCATRPLDPLKKRGAIARVFVLSSEGARGFSLFAGRASRKLAHSTIYRSVSSRSSVSVAVVAMLTAGSARSRVAQ